MAAREVVMFRRKTSIAAFAVCISTLCVAAPWPATAEDILVTQYKADPSGAPYGVAIDKGFFKKAGVDITGVISGEGGGTSVRAVIASALGYGETSPAAAIAANKQGQDLKRVQKG
jgi:NitT/TauT family transport system substrate-binding protein